MMKYYILDTDLGDDIDDAYALNLALKKNVNLIGITTVFNDTKLRARIAKKMLYLFGKKLPVYFGKHESLDGYVRPNIFSQYTDDLMDDLYKPTNSEEEEAIDYIIASAKKYKQELYLICIGPLTNIASAILKDPDTMKQIGGIIMMGGQYVSHYIEWNIKCDVRAAKIVIESGINIVAFGHEVTSVLKLDENEQNILLNNNATPYDAYLSELLKLWLRDKRPGWKVVLHDVMTIRYIIDPSYCDLKKIACRVEDKGEYTYGLTMNLSVCDGIFDENYIHICSSNDVLNFKKYFIENL